jgi:hypothetical protein
MVYIQTSHFFKSDEKDNNENLKLRDEAMTLFLDRVSERSGLKFDKEDLSHGDKFYQLYLKSSGIKYPDAFSKFKIFYTPKKEIRQHGNNLVTWFMKSQNFKGTKIRELLNKYDNIDLNGLKIFYETFGQDLFNTINSESFLSAETPNYFAYYGSIIENISKIEKDLEISDKTNFGRTTSVAFIERYCSKLNINNELTQVCKFISMKIEKMNLMTENTPHSIAAGIVYFVAQYCQLNISKKDVKNVSEISEVTINKCQKKLEKMKDTLIPPAILKKYNS